MRKLGWDEVFTGDNKPITLAKAVKFVKDEFTNHKILKTAAVKANPYDDCKYEVYGAVKDTNDQVYGVVILLNWSNKQFHKSVSYKIMAEDVEPFYYNCPAKILDMLSPTDNERALRWRTTCRQTTAGAIASV